MTPQWRNRRQPDKLHKETKSKSIKRFNFSHNKNEIKQNEYSPKQALELDCDVNELYVPAAHAEKFNINSQRRAPDMLAGLLPSGQ